MIAASRTFVLAQLLFSVTVHAVKTREKPAAAAAAEQAPSGRLADVADDAVGAFSLVRKFLGEEGSTTLNPSSVRAASREHRNLLRAPPALAAMQTLRAGMKSSRRLREKTPSMPYHYLTVIDEHEALDPGRAGPSSSSSSPSTLFPRPTIDGRLPEFVFDESENEQEGETIGTIHEAPGGPSVLERKTHAALHLTDTELKVLRVLRDEAEKHAKKDGLGGGEVAELEKSVAWKALDTLVGRKALPAGIRPPSKNYPKDPLNEARWCFEGERHSSSFRGVVARVPVCRAAQRVQAMSYVTKQLHKCWRDIIAHDGHAACSFSNEFRQLVVPEMRRHHGFEMLRGRIMYRGLRWPFAVAVSEALFAYDVMRPVRESTSGGAARRAGEEHHTVKAYKASLRRLLAEIQKAYVIAVNVQDGNGRTLNEEGFNRKIGENGRRGGLECWWFKLIRPLYRSQWNELEVLAVARKLGLLEEKSLEEHVARYDPTEARLPGEVHGGRGFGTDDERETPPGPPQEDVTRGELSRAIRIAQQFQEHGIWRKGPPTEDEMRLD
mmetsp:Transcript_27918/g.70593  ORF Transcript_27918/g.70593 Transcript_27918/m.70593 type:complete len:552 (-) Transcript_27918:635-2290(-)|eukprot:CAMPEP_0178989262 /NCGR_PEP_ID=MMETSP0795-20121207/4263_1 /TAXON_ID=88552 /ORGANISM="Amoebophrya sp., Strain Ameob2" /LENGTH=551 /DNA_ID=CAMNT_0020680617 /DNA_START=243 /DNA_END=1898 /DNA_ORIENTATION=-